MLFSIAGPAEGVGPLIVALAFAEQPGLVESDLLVGGVLGLLRPGQIDFVLPELLVDAVDGFVEETAVEGVVEEAWRCLLYTSPSPRD